MKKKIEIILGGILCIMWILSRTSISEESITTSASPISSKVIVLDAGHGKPDNGAVGIYGTTEESINLQITQKLQELIEKSGGYVIVTRSDENGIYSSSATTIREKKIDDIKKRAEIGNMEGVDIFVSIHLNKYEQEKYYGWQTFYQEENKESFELAKCIQENIKNVITKENNRVPQTVKDVYLMKNIKCPMVIVECGFLSNEEEAMQLQDEKYQDKLAFGIYMGIQEFFN